MCGTDQGSRCKLIERNVLISMILSLEEGSLQPGRPDQLTVKTVRPGVGTGPELV
jgi:hypothetical protein